MRTQVRSLAWLDGGRIQHSHELWCRWQTQLGSCVAVPVVEASSYSFNSTPRLGTCICCMCRPKKKRERKSIKLLFSLCPRLGSHSLAGAGPKKEGQLGSLEVLVGKSLSAQTKCIFSPLPFSWKSQEIQEPRSRNSAG